MKFSTFRMAVLAGAVLAPCIMALSASAAEAVYELPMAAKACNDSSLENAINNGLVLGINEGMPWAGIDQATGKEIGIDVEIINEVLDRMEIKYSYMVSQFSSLIPSMLSKRLDIVVADVHVTEERLKSIAFSGPVWWYGPALVVEKGNPKNVKSFDDLRNVKVGVLLGSGPDEYLKGVGIEATRFQSDGEQFAALQQNRIDVSIAYDLLAAQFLKANPEAAVESITDFDIPDDLVKNGYGYARFGMRQEDCSLRMALDQALAEARASGAVSAILARYGLSDRNLFVFSPNVAK